MSGLRDHRVYVFKYTRDIEHAVMDGGGGVNPTGQFTPGHEEEKVLIAPDNEEMAHAFFRERTRYLRHVNLVSMEVLKIDGALTEEIY